MSSDETFLESFLDSLTGLPNEVKRNMELIKDLDKSCTGLTEELKHRHRDYIQQAEEKVLSLELVASSSSDDTNPPGIRVGGDNGEVIIPTTEELMSLISQPGALQTIRNLESNALQLADEKVAIASQTHSLISSIVKRLDADLESMEKILQTAGEFEAPGAAKPDDLAAVQIAQGSDWILAKVISHDPATGMYQLKDEDVESNKIFNLPESQVVVLNGVDKLGRGDVVFAVYPDTTAFYQATVVQAPRKSGQGGFVMVSFIDDSDEHGVTHDKAVPIQHVMLSPYGATIQ